MTESVVVLGAGYGGASAVQRLEATLDGVDAELTWVSQQPYHFVRHEAHRLIRTPGLQDELRVPVRSIVGSDTTFVEGTVTAVDVDGRRVHLDDGTSLEYDYLLVCLGSRTACYGIEGLDEHATTLEDRSDALAINGAVEGAADEASPDDPASVLVGGAGLTGIQVAGEVAAFRDERRAPLSVELVEQEDAVFPGHDDAFQSALRESLQAHDVEVETGATIDRVESSSVTFVDGSSTDFDVFVWAGGVTGRAALSDVALATDHDRVHASATFETDDHRVFAVGDSALIDQPDDDTPMSEGDVWEAVLDPERGNPPPPTAEAAWEAAEVAAENVARRLQGCELVAWRYEDKGTLVSVGDDVVAHDVVGVPVDTFGGVPAALAKKAVGARWLATVDAPRRAVRAWPDL